MAERRNILTIDGLGAALEQARLTSAEREALELALALDAADPSR